MTFGLGAVKTVKGFAPELADREVHYYGDSGIWTGYRRSWDTSSK